MNLETAAQPLSLRPGPAGAAATSVAQLAAGVPLLGAHLAATVEWAVAAAAETPAPGEGRTRETWEVLASAAAADVAGARILEPHLDARSILREASDAGIPVDLDAIGDRSDGSWGCTRRRARGWKPAPRGMAGGWTARRTGVRWPER